MSPVVSIVLTREVCSRASCRYLLNIHTLTLPSRFRHSMHTLPQSKPIPNLQPQANSNYNSNSKLNAIPNRERFDTSSIVLDKSIYNGNSRIISLGRLAKVDEARRMFDEMPHRDIVSYASMITVYLKHNDLLQAEQLFRAMPEWNIVVDSAMVNGYAKAGRMDEAQGIFDNMPERNVFSWTSLISGYLRSGRVHEARQLFERMPEKNVVSWTTVVLGYARNGLIDQARTVFDQMPEKNVVSWTAMMKAYVENFQIDEALKLFHQMPLRNIYSWNIVIHGFLDEFRVNEAIQLFISMPRRNAVSWTTMVTGLARTGSTKLARQYFDQMPKKDTAAWNAMITAYADEGLMAMAIELFNLMPERNTVTWNAMIDGYARNGPEGEAFKYLILMLRCCIRLNETTLTSLLTSCESIQLLQAHSLVVRLGFECETSLINALVTMYSRSGDVSSAWLAFENLEAKDIVSWTAIIVAYSSHGYGTLSLQAFARMLRSGTKPDEITFVGVLSACSHAGLVNKGQRLFNSMRCAYDLEPKAEHYACLVDTLGRAGLVDEATRVVRKMPPSERDVVVLGALLGACKLNGDVALASNIGEELIEVEPASSGGYVLLANVYAACEKWDEFARIRKKMKERKVKKVPGFSQIEVQGKNHVFFVGDRSHPEVKEIYILLQEKLLPLMLEMGYRRGSSLACL
ncbi:unnamed protein product [Ilex paraguariensis]|uniref:Chlororespiratory reduction 4 n=1 Tax=Ilex paraguariensis TaxID=185542 RepID=A0ABC8TK12_9AQUA